MSQYPKHDAALAMMKSFVGVYESPPHSNRGPLQHRRPQAGVDFFEAHDFVTGTGYPWCVCTCLTAWSESGHALPYLSPGAWAWADWARRAGWVVPIFKAVPGDLMVWNEGSGHMSMLETTYVSGPVHTIDGNWNDAVQHAQHDLRNLRAAIHIPENAVKPPIPVPQPFWVVTTSVNGTRRVVFSKFATEKTVLGLVPRWIAKYGRGGFTIKKGGVRK